MKIKKLSQLKICIKGAGEMASAVAHRLYNANINKIFMLETDHPQAVRRKVSFCEALYEHSVTVEGVTAKKTSSPEEIESVWQQKNIPLLSDSRWRSIKSIQPDIVIDAILAKKNLGTCLNEADLVIGLGPGFEAGKDVHLVIETNRGHDLGRILESGKAQPNTGIPGNINGFTKQRVLRAPCDGILKSVLKIGSFVKANDLICQIENQDVTAEIDGIVRGLIRNGSVVKNSMKIGDIDPRAIPEFCATISEKARAIAGSVLEAVLRKYNV